MNKQRVDFPVGENACHGKRGTSRGRLVELIESTRYWGSGTSEEIADYLLANGVIVPPVKVGQSFWHIEEYAHQLLPDKYPTAKVVCKGKVEKIFIEKYGNSFGDTRKSFSFHDIGKTVFLAKEEAEAKLKKGGAE